MNTKESDTRNSGTESSILQTILTQTETNARVSVANTEVIYFVGLKSSLLNVRNIIYSTVPVEV